MSRILVTGGLGYIGSHTIVDLLDAGYDIVSLDNLSNASPEVIDGIQAITGKRIQNIKADLSNKEEALNAVKQAGAFDAIIHFAALKRVEESVFHPTLYFQNNVEGTITTMLLMEQLEIPFLIFSSSCTVYGAPDELPVTETTPFGKAESPYGASKQACEILYGQFFEATQKQNIERPVGRAGVSLRYFNPAGAHPSALIGEAPLHKPTALVPVITETAIGKRKEIVVHGIDYSTRDGSCVRDFIHIMDLARAHTLALEYLLKGRNQESYETYNLGSGEGITVLEAIHAFEEATGEKLNYRIGPRRAGDVPAIFADHKLISSQLNWAAEYSLHDIMYSAWEWEKNRARKS